MTCEACVYKVTHILSHISGVKSATVSLPNKALVETEVVIPFTAFQEAFDPHTKYGIQLATNTDAETPQPMVENRSWIVTYRPILLIFGFITTVSVLTAFQHGIYDWEHWSPMHGMNAFMAGFFLVFSFFKLLDIQAFADSYVMYDLLAARWKTWGKLYPFVELGLGLAYLVHVFPVATNVLTLVVMGFSSLGVIQSVLNKQKIRCACLGAVFNLPMSTVTIIEDLLMVAMAGAMLLMN